MLSHLNLYVSYKYEYSVKELNNFNYLFVGLSTVRIIPQEKTTLLQNSIFAYYLVIVENRSKWVYFLSVVTDENRFVFSAEQQIFQDGDQSFGMKYK